MAVTRDDLDNYQSMKKLLEELNREYQQAFNTYHSPSFDWRNQSGHASVSPQEKAMKKIERIEGRMNEVMDEMETIESYVDSIEDYDVRAIILCHYINGETWDASASYLNESQSNIRSKARKYFKAHDMM